MVGLQYLGMTTFKGYLLTLQTGAVMAMYLLANASTLGWFVAWFGPALITLWFLIKRQPQSREVAAWVFLTLATGFVGSAILGLYLFLTKNTNPQPTAQPRFYTN